MTEELILPIVHVNGTSKEQLLADRYEFLDALLKAGEKIGKIAPNGRDYYPGGPELLDQAEEQFKRRRALLRGLADEIEAEIGELL